MDRFIVTAGALLHDPFVYVARCELQRKLSMHGVDIHDRSLSVTEEEEEEGQINAKKTKAIISLNFTGRAGQESRNSEIKSIFKRYLTTDQDQLKWMYVSFVRRHEVVKSSSLLSAVITKTTSL